MIGSATLYRRHARYLSDHPPVLGSPGDEIGKTNSDPEYTKDHQTPKLKWLIAYYYDEKREHLFCLLLHILFLLDTIGAFIDCLVCMYVIFVLSTIRFVIIRLGIAALFIILQQLMLLLLSISLFAKVQLLLPEFFCEGAMQPLSVF